MQWWCLYKTAEGYHTVLCIWKASGTSSIQEEVLEQQSWWEETACLTKTGSQVEKLVLFCESHIRKNLQINSLYTRRLLYNEK